MHARTPGRCKDLRGYVTSGRRNCSENRKSSPIMSACGFQDLKKKTGLFEAWKPESGARVTGRVKMAETSMSGTDISISIISL